MSKNVFYNFVLVQIVNDHNYFRKFIINHFTTGVDSTVGGCLVAQAVPEAFRPIFVDTGLLRLDERGEVEKRLGSIIGDGKLLTIDASETFYSELKGVTDPEKKRKVIGRLFIETFDQAVKEMNLNPEHCSSKFDNVK